MLLRLLLSFPYLFIIVFRVRNSQLFYQSHSPFISRAYHTCIRFQCFRHLAVAGYRRHGTGSQLLIRQFHIDGAVRYIYFDDVTVLNLTDIASGSRFGRDMSDAQSGSAATEASVGNQRTLLA